MKNVEARTPGPWPSSEHVLERGPLMFAVVLFLMVYGVEIFNFGLSIDEEAATYISGNEWTWLQQGRWGMALIALALPNFEAIPLLSTLLFGAGLLYATWRAFDDFSLSRQGSYLFAAVHVGLPVWLHIVQFSTLAAGVGFGLAAASAGAAAVASGRKKDMAAGILLIAFAMSVYQTLGLYALLYGVLCVHASWNRTDERRLEGAPWKGRALATILGAIGGWTAGILLYVLVQRVALAVVDKDMVYVSEFLHLDLLLTQPATILASTVSYLRSLFIGTNSTFLGWGAGLLFVVWLGLLPTFVLDNQFAGRRRWRAWLTMLAVAALGTLIVSVPIAMSNGGLPMRSQVAFPLLAAWIASRSGRFFETRPPAIIWCVLGYFSIVATSIGASLFYVDQVVHRADAALTQRLVPAIQKAAGPATAQGDIPVSLVGSHAFKFDGNLKPAELFGTSFYEHDRGNIYRVGLFMQLQGVEGVHPVWLKDRPELIPAAMSMPIWPADGSVQLVHGVVLVKLGPPTPPQIGEP